MHPTSQSQPGAAATPSESTARQKPAPLLRSEFRDDPDMREILEEFVAALPEQVVQLQKLLAAHDLDSLRRLVHQIKGAGGGYGFDRITEYAAKAEAAIRENAPEASIQQQIRELVDLIRSVEGYQEPCDKTVCPSKP